MIKIAAQTDNLARHKDNNWWLKKLIITISSDKKKTGQSHIEYCKF